MRWRWPVIALILTLGGLSPGHTGEIEWIRRGTAWVRVEQPCSLNVTIRDGQVRVDGYLYVFGPDGDEIWREPIESETTGTVVQLNAGPGDYRVVCGADAALQVEADGPVVLEPEREWPGLHQRKEEGRRYWFHVPEGTERFALTATNHYGANGAPSEVALYAPHGAEAARMQFDRLNPELLAEALDAPTRVEMETAFRILTQSHEEQSPAPGMWSVEAGCEGYDDDIGFWLEGVPNYVAGAPEDWFEPRMQPGQTRLAVDAGEVIGPTGETAVIAGFHQQAERVVEALQDLAMPMVTEYTGQSFREPANDDEDPAHFNWEGFNFGPADDRSDWLPRAGVTGLMHVYGSTPDWLGPVGGQVWMHNLPEVAEFVAAFMWRYAVDRPVGRRYYTFINEPNLALREFDDAKKRYIDSYLAVGERVKALDAPEMQQVRLGGPNIAIGERNPEWDWVADLLKAADEYVDFVSYDVYAYPLLDQTWRYADDIRFVQELIEEHDSDGQREEILIYETNLRGGLYLQSWRQDTHYSAVWWASVLNHALGTGGLRAITYFTLIEQGARRKGLLTEELEPKPVYYAMRLYNRNLLPTVVHSESSHGQVDCLATIDEAGERVSVFVVNRARRPIDLTARVRLPEALHEGARLMVTRFTPEATEPVEGEPQAVQVQDGLATVRETLPARSVTLMMFADEG